MLSETLARLYRLHTEGIKFGLEIEQVLLARLGNPEKQLACVHVAGTNGKGSVCAMLEAVLRASGLSVGFYSSPHLVRFHERIRVDGQCISDAELETAICRVEKEAAAVAKMPDGRPPTFFEFVTALAFDYFQQRKVDVAVLETGMGGRLDATNVVTPLLSVITGISIEHTAYLGPDLASIAREKAGIVKPGRPVIVGPLPDPAMTVIGCMARDRRARLVRAEETVSVRRVSQSLKGQKLAVSSSVFDVGAVNLKMLGRHQMANAAVAVAALGELAGMPGFGGITPDTLKAGLNTVSWPGRFQVLRESPPVILDGAHNPEAGDRLVETLGEILKKIPLGLVVGMCADKDSAQFLKPFKRLVRRCWAVPLNIERSLPVEAMAGLARTHGWDVTESTVEAALREAVQWAAANRGAVCIAGSLYLVGEVLALVGKEKGWEGSPARSATLSVAGGTVHG
ncbi:MAG: bifunctional folylpolyglutamate synthase/dihydrofolate synthase [Lentisphaerae bacterium]|nr:bifunctional folylpolyglutamate synthase/dihydrofolate synthase [Lentisphaerota bacterium]